MNDPLRLRPGRGPDKVACPRCARSTDPREMVHTPALGWSCLRCVEDSRPETEGT